MNKQTNQQQVGSKAHRLINSGFWALMSDAQKKLAQCPKRP